MGCVLPRYFYVLTGRINEKRMSNDKVSPEQLEAIRRDVQKTRDFMLKQQAKRKEEGIEELEYDGPRDRTVTISKHEVVLDRDATEDIWEVAFGADAFEKGYTDQEVLKVLRSFSDKALKLDKALRALKAVVKDLWEAIGMPEEMIDTHVRNLLDGCERVIQEIEDEN